MARFWESLLDSLLRDPRQRRLKQIARGAGIGPRSNSPHRDVVIL
jgi:hypothetical protein